MDETNALLREILQELKKLTAKREDNRPKRSDVKSGGFPEFWEAYPRAKAGKFAAQKAYDKAIGIDTHQAIMDGVRRFSIELKNNPRDTSLIPHASTWLNAGRWMDEDNKTVQEQVRNERKPVTFDDSAEKENNEQRRLADEWTEKKIAELPQDVIISIKREIMIKWKEAIAMKPSIGSHLYKAEIRKRYGCPYKR